jgi:hypothetical protein
MSVFYNTAAARPGENRCEGVSLLPDKVKAVPDASAGPTPYIAVSNGAAAIDFYKQVFGAVERFRIGRDGGPIGHAELDRDGQHLPIRG